MKYSNGFCFVHISTSPHFVFINQKLGSATVLKYLALIAGKTWPHKFQQLFDWLTKKTILWSC